MINIYDTANQMERDLRKTSQYQELQTAYEALKADEKAFKCFNEIHSLQEELQKKQMSGQKPTEDDFKKLQDLCKEADGYETLQTLMQKEQALSMMMDELSKIIFRPIQELYKD
ncbi:YlbF family regulator [Ligilactobacillus ruminis]|uniref:YlbF family regulator n=1 Tax=Ligilactobacillus ruminis TaxID=1623 RepID=UPI003F955C32